MIRQILKGIDEDQIQSDDGYWTTGSGVMFGTQVLKEAVEYEAELLNEIEKLKSLLIMKGYKL